jgi:predicted transcriptional regulator
MVSEIINQLKLVDKHIEKQDTGSISELARKVGLSARSVHEYLNLIRKSYTRIKFCRFRQSYYYENSEE